MGCAQRKTHCFHALEHLETESHFDKVCCWCGYRVCSKLDLVWDGAKQHGSFNPDKRDHEATVRYLLARIPDSEGLRENRKFMKKFNLGDRHLPNRQKMVLERIADGMTTEQIAKDIGIAVQTVNCHRQFLRDRFEAKNLFEVVAKAIRQGYI